MQPRLPLTEMAQEAVAQVLQPGDVAIDATVGNGHDTLLLASCVGQQGKVYGFDVQELALQQARARLRDAGVSTPVEWFLAGHETMLQRIPVEQQGRVQVIMFNLGFLPGSDKQCITRAETTLHGLQQGLSLLSPGGAISILVYTGHDRGREEADALHAWMNRLDETRWSASLQRNDYGRRPSPEWIWVRGHEPEDGADRTAVF